MRRACPLTIFSTLCTTLPHNMIKEKLLDLIEWSFKRALKTMVHFIWPVMTEKLFSINKLTLDMIYSIITNKIILNKALPLSRRSTPIAQLILKLSYIYDSFLTLGSFQRFGDLGKRAICFQGSEKKAVAITLYTHM